MKAVVITANYGSVDGPPHAPVRQRDVDVEWHYYTDAYVKAPDPWITHHVAPLDANPNLAAKFYRATPPITTTPHVIWIDANMQIMHPLFVVGALASRRDGIAAWRHPRRDCVYTEAVACLEHESQGGKYEAYRERIYEQVATYKDEGYPAHNGLYACGTIAWDLSAPDVHEFGTAWLRECHRWSPQDQVSFPVVAWRLGLKPGMFPVPQIQRMMQTPAYLANSWLRIHTHRIGSG